jgi:DNA-binding MarR family transcriptional regulator
LKYGDHIFSIQDSLGFELAKAIQNIEELFAKELEKFGISSKHFGTLLIVSENPNITQVEAAKIQRVDRTSMGQLIDLLEGKQLLNRNKHPTDRRAYCLQLTSKGEDVVDFLWGYMKTCEEKVLSVLDEQEKMLFLNLIKKISKENYHE